MLEVIKKIFSSISGYILFLFVLFVVLGIIACFYKLGSEIISAIISVLQKYWYATVICALVIIYLAGKSNDKK
jgi:hypothetical protein